MDDNALRRNALRRMETSPLACGFILLADLNDLTVDEIVDPWTTHYLVYQASVITWFVPHDSPWTRSVMHRDDGRLFGALRDAVMHPATAWWSRHVASFDQMEMVLSHGPPLNLPEHIEEVLQRQASRDRSEQNHPVGIRTSTATPNGLSGSFTEYAIPPEDWIYQCPTDRLLYRITNADDSREVIHINTDEEWHRLCLRFPREVGDGMIEPDWHLASRHVAGVHVTILGLLSFHGMTVTTGRVASKVPTWWDHEFTQWLAPHTRLAFKARLPTLEGWWAMPTPPLAITEVPELEDMCTEWEKQHPR